MIEMFQSINEIISKVSTTYGNHLFSNEISSGSWITL